MVLWEVVGVLGIVTRAGEETLWVVAARITDSLLFFAGCKNGLTLAIVAEVEEEDEAAEVSVPTGAEISKGLGTPSGALGVGMGE
jgi:hypothetical protein